jgi:hypothetical protein
MLTKLAPDLFIKDGAEQTHLLSWRDLAYQLLQVQLKQANLHLSTGLARVTVRPHRMSCWWFA